MSLCKVHNEISEKYSLENPGELPLTTGNKPPMFKRKRREKTPFTGYPLVYKNDGVYVDVPDGKDEIVSG